MAQLTIFAWLCIGHAIADYPLQGDWLAKAKNPTLTLVPGETIWPLALLSHSAIHAGAVHLVTGSWLLASFEFIAHAVTDFVKCKGIINYNQDQLIHIACKACWAELLIFGVLP